MLAAILLVALPILKPVLQRASRPMRVVVAGCWTLMTIADAIVLAAGEDTPLMRSFAVVMIAILAIAISAVVAGNCPAATSLRPSKKIAFG